MEANQWNGPAVFPLQDRTSQPLLAQDTPLDTTEYMGGLHHQYVANPSPLAHTYAMCLLTHTHTLTQSQTHALINLLLLEGRD